MDICYLAYCGSTYRPEVHREVRARPAYNGDGGLYDLTKHRDSPATAHRPGPAGLLQQNAVKPPTQGRSQPGEMNFSLYGYLPYNPMYISHEKLNHALASPAKEESSRTARQVPPAVPLDGADEAPGKPTSVIVEHRGAPRHQQALISVDPYRCRGSITHGTAAGVKPVSAATPLRQTGTSAAQPLPPRDEVPSWSKKPTCVVNGLCWTGSQTLPSAGRPVSPPSKVDLISQGLVPNPLYSSAAVGAHRSVTEVLPKPAVAGVDYAMDMSAKRTAVTRYEAPPKRSRCDDVLPAQWPPQSQGQGQGQGQGPQSVPSYIDSFKSFVDHAVHCAFMNDEKKDTAAQSAPPTQSADSQNTDDQTKPPPMGSILHTLDASPKTQSRTLPPKTAYLSTSQSDPTLAVAGTEPGVHDGGAAFVCEKLAVSTSVQSFSSPSQMPSLAAPTQLTSTSPATANNGPPLLVPQCPIESVDDDHPSVTASPALSTTAGSDRVLGRGGGDTDSDTLSANSPAPVLLPADATPSTTNACSSSLHLKKNWLLRYSDEDRKNVVTIFDNGGTSRSSDLCDKSQDAADVDEKSSGDVWGTKQKQTSENSSEDSTPAIDTKAVKPSSEKQRQDLNKKGSSKFVAGISREAEEASKLTDGKDSIKNCFINCTYVSDKDQDARSLRRIAKESGLEEKDAQSNTSKESDDSQTVCYMFVNCLVSLNQSFLFRFCYLEIRLRHLFLFLCTRYICLVVVTCEFVDFHISK